MGCPAQNPAIRARGCEPPANRWIHGCYGQLYAIARRLLAGERHGVGLEPSELIHEAYLRLAEIDRVRWETRSHFLAIAATQMRRVLVDQARAALTQKRGSRPERVPLTPEVEVVPAQSIEALAVREALGRLARRRPRQARVAEMHLFHGLRLLEIAELLCISLTTAKDDWHFARTRLAVVLARQAST